MRLIKTSLFIVALTVFCTLQETHAQEQLTIDAFRALIAQQSLVFEMPEGYTVAEVKPSRDLQYVFAIINEDESMEIRYSIWPLAPSFEVYEKVKDDPNSSMAHPNELYPIRMQSNLIIMTDGNVPEVGDFDERALKSEFNADAGGTAFFEFKCDFGRGYKYGQAVYLHKDDIADVIVTYMSNDKERHVEEMKRAFHALQFGGTTN